VAFLTTTFSIGQIVGPYISGLMIDFFGDYQNAMLLSGCSLFMAGICMINYKLLFSRL
jgi:MFS family permease